MGDFDLSLIHEFSSCRSFYDRNSPQFKDRLYNAHLWQEISNKLGFDVTILRDRMVQLRNRYNLEKRRIEQLQEENPGKVYESPWPLYNHLHFLSDHIRARRSYKKMRPLNGSGTHDKMIAGDGGGDAELSNSYSNNSNLTLRHNIPYANAMLGPGGGNGQHLAPFPNGLLAVKMEDNSEETDADSSSPNNSEINAFDPAGLIPETHSSPLPPVYNLQQQQIQQPAITIRSLDSLKQDHTDNSLPIYNKRQKRHRQHQHQHQQQQVQRLQYSAAASINNNSSQQNCEEPANSTAPPPPKQPCLNTREVKYTAFGNFISSSLQELPPSIALSLVERFTGDIVQVLMEKARQDEQKEEQQNQQQQQQQEQQQQNHSDVEN